MQPRLVLRALLSSSIAFAAASAAAQPTDAELSQRLAELEKDSAHRSALSEPLGKAKRALERARRTAPGASWAPADKAADRQAGLLRAVSGAWLDAARDLVRAVDAEKTADDAQKKLDEAGTKVARARALLEETIARRSRTQAQLDALDRPKTEPPPAPTTAPGGKTPSPAGKAPPAPAPPAKSEPAQ